MPMKRLAYASDTTDREWAMIAGYIPAPLPNGRPPKQERREIVDAILYVLKTGCPQNRLPHDFLPYSTVFWYFRQWRKEALGRAQLVRDFLGEEASKQRYPDGFVLLPRRWVVERT